MRRRFSTYVPTLAFVLFTVLSGCGNPVTGTWTGSTDSPGAASVPTQLNLTESGGGAVTGTVLVTLPGVTGFHEADQLTGTRTGDSLPLVGGTGITINLTRSGITLSGPVTFSLVDPVGDGGFIIAPDGGPAGGDGGNTPADAGPSTPLVAQITVTKS